MRRPTRLGIAIVLLSVACAACSTILGIGELDAGETKDGAFDGPASSDSTTTDGTAEGGAQDAPGTPDADGSVGPPGEAGGDARDSSVGIDAGDSSVGIDASDSGSLPDTYVVGDGSFTTSPLSPTTITTAGAVIAPTGNAQQNHLAVATGDGRAWYFYVDDDTTTIKARVSSDYASWSDGGSLSLGAGTNSGYGSDFSVAYASLGGTDVVHLVVSEETSTGTTMHLRATITGAPGAGSLGLTGSTTDFSQGTLCHPDGPSTVIAPGGLVFDATGLPNNHGTYCDLDVYQSSVADNGGTWSATFAQTGYYVVSPGVTSAHQLVAFGANGLLGGAFANGEDNSSPYALVSWASTVGSYSWPDASSVSVFPLDGGGPAGGAGYDDWSLCRISDTEVYALRHLTDPSGATASSFEQAVYDGSTWQPVSPPAGIVSTFDNGLVLVSEGAQPAMLAFAIGDGPNASTIYGAKWASGSWSGWQAFTPDSASKTSLAGSGCGSAHPMIFWTEPGSPQTIVGADVSAFFP